MPFIQEDWVPRQMGLPEYDPNLRDQKKIIRVLVTTNRNIVTIAGRIKNSFGEWSWGRVKGPIKAWAYLPSHYDGKLIPKEADILSMERTRNLLSAFELVKNGRNKPELILKKGEKQTPIFWRKTKLYENDSGDLVLEIPPDD